MDEYLQLVLELTFCPCAITDGAAMSSQMASDPLGGLVGGLALALPVYLPPDVSAGLILTVFGDITCLMAGLV